MTRIALELLAALLACSCITPQAGTRPPNILFVFADDLGWKDVGFQGSELCETPNLDRLRRESVMFSQAYAAAGNCAPSRACLLSGQYTPRHGVYAVGSTERGNRQMMRTVPIRNRQDLPPEKVTLAEALRDAGYATGLFGKWHLGHADGTRPTDQGFDTYVDPRQPDPNKKRDEPADPKGIYSLTTAAIEFMREQGGSRRPFFAFVSHHAIHSTLEARPASLARVRARHPELSQRDATYAACTYDLDCGVGLLLRFLDESGLADDTIVVFTSDNGGTGQISQEPLRGAKGGYYEAGIREPMLVRWPGTTKAGATVDTPVCLVDMYPTLLAMAGAERPIDTPLDGEDLTPLLRGDGGLSRAAIFWHFPGYLNSPVPRGRDPVFRTRPVSVIRKGDFKLHLYHEEWSLDGGREALATNRAVELYDLRHDEGERHDLAGEDPKRRDELLDDLLAWIAAIDAPVCKEPNPRFDANVTGGR
ncbi:MAG: sulfatase [Planctomycetes bacterium]|nr:sulfatase [Planctomycetota bacterium]